VKKEKEVKSRKRAQGITIYDVAADAGVSLATVSRVINNSAVVRPERRERVLASIKKLNFKPNEIARGLARQKSTNIGVLVPDLCRSETSELLSGIVDTANLKQYGYGVNVNSYLTNIVSFNQQVDKMISHRVDGLLVMADELTDAMHQTLTNLSIPVVVFATAHKFSDLPSVALNYERVAQDIVDYISAQKYQSATIITRDTEAYAYGLSGFFTTACAKNNIALNEQLIKADLNYEKTYRVLYEVYKHGDIPPIVFATNDMFALAFSNVVQDLGKQVPADVEIISFSNTQLALVGRPKITSVMYPVYRIGAYAIGMLTKLIQEKSLDDIVSLENEYEIIWRESTKHEIKK